MLQTDSRAGFCAYGATVRALGGFVAANHEPIAAVSEGSMLTNPGAD